MFHKIIAHETTNIKKNLGGGEGRGERREGRGERGEGRGDRGKGRGGEGEVVASANFSRNYEEEGEESG